MMKNKFFDGPPGFRNYSSGLARFVSTVRLQEQLAGSDAYAYALGNPILYSQPDGNTVQRSRSNYLAEDGYDYENGHSQVNYSYPPANPDLITKKCKKPSKVFPPNPICQYTKTSTCLNMPIRRNSWWQLYEYAYAETQWKNGSTYTCEEQEKTYPVGDTCQALRLPKPKNCPCPKNTCTPTS